MKCENCNIKIDPSFKYAIKLNNCPACGKSIMDPVKLASYMSLRQLIDSNFKDFDSSEKLANLIVANFDIKQLFKEDSVGSGETVSVEVEEDHPDYVKEDELHKIEQMKEAKRILEKEKAYESALREQYGMGSEDDVGGESNEFFGTGVEANTIEIAGRLKSAQKQEDSKSGMLSGAGGFSRSNA